MVDNLNPYDLNFTDEENRFKLDPALAAPDISSLTDSVSNAWGQTQRQTNAAFNVPPSDPTSFLQLLGPATVATTPSILSLLNSHSKDTTTPGAYGTENDTLTGGANSTVPGGNSTIPGSTSTPVTATGNPITSDMLTWEDWFQPTLGPTDSTTFNGPWGFYGIGQDYNPRVNNENQINTDKAYAPYEHFTKEQMLELAQQNADTAMNKSLANAGAGLAQAGLQAMAGYMFFNPVSIIIALDSMFGSKPSVGPGMDARIMINNGQVSAGNIGVDNEGSPYVAQTIGNTVANAINWVAQEKGIKLNDATDLGSIGNFRGYWYANVHNGNRDDKVYRAFTKPEDAVLYQAESVLYKNGIRLEDSERQALYDVLKTDFNKFRQEAMDYTNWIYENAPNLVPGYHEEN